MSTWEAIECTYLGVLYLPVSSNSPPGICKLFTTGKSHAPAHIKVLSSYVRGLQGLYRSSRKSSPRISVCADADFRTLYSGPYLVQLEATTI